MGMDLNEYYVKALRTCDKKLTIEQMRLHALHLIASETGEIHSIFQKAYQGHEIRESEVVDEAGDLLWGICELLFTFNCSLERCAKRNVEKLLKRYPNGFEAERSLHRNQCEQHESQADCESDVEYINTPRFVGWPVNDTISVSDVTTKIFTGLLDSRINNDLLSWRFDNHTREGWLTLREIKEQLAEKGINFFTVYADDPLHGHIYMTGNYNDGKFYLFGETMGYV